MTKNDPWEAAMASTARAYMRTLPVVTVMKIAGPATEICWLVSSGVSGQGVMCRGSGLRVLPLSCKAQCSMFLLNYSSGLPFRAPRLAASAPCSISPPSASINKHLGTP